MLTDLKAIHLATKLSWRWGFWITLLSGGLGALGLFFFYFPPTFDEVHIRDHRTLWQELKVLDFVGVILFVGGITVLLLGISWGGVTYPWKSAGVIVPILIGAFTLVAFGFWEVYANLTDPIVPYKLFKNVRGFTMVLVTEGVTGMLLYALISLYPIQIQAVYESRASNRCVGVLYFFDGDVSWSDPDGQYSGENRPCQIDLGSLCLFEHSIYWNYGSYE